MGYETDRPFGGSWDLGLDRFVAQAGGPLVGGSWSGGGIDVNGRLDADPVNAPAPTDPRDPVPPPLRCCRTTVVSSGAAWARSRFPVTDRIPFRLLGLHSEDQRLLYDPAYKYDLDLAPGSAAQGTSSPDTPSSPATQDAASR